MILVHSEHKCDLLATRQGTIHGSMKHNHDNGQLAFYKINVVVSILVSVYRHQQRVDTPTVHYYCMLHTHLQATYDKHKFPTGPFSHNCSHTMIVPVLITSKIKILIKLNIISYSEVVIAIAICTHSRLYLTCHREWINSWLIQCIM